MKLPNGYGQVYKLKGNRRRPWIARVTTDWIVDVENGKCKPVVSTIGYYENRKLALQALADYNQNPYDIDAANVTFTELYEKWSKEHFEKISDSRIRGTKSAYSKCVLLYNMKFKDIKAAHLEGVLNNCNIGQATKQHIKSLFNQLYKYAMKNDIVRKDYSALVNTVGKYEREKKIEIFTDEEIQKLWDNLNIENVDIILIGIYSGWRPSELTGLEVENINLLEKTMIGGIKTDNGINRIVPIHTEIFSLIENRINTSNKLLFDINYEQYRYSYKKIMKALDMNHKPHETRHTFISKAKEYGLDEYCLKLIVGHAISDLTERVYTHRQLNQLIDEINKIQ
nr:tyrosine-type recombinase/integrase [uncultured Cellulosilyticum sp.]